LKSLRHSLEINWDFSSPLCNSLELIQDCSEDLFHFFFIFQFMRIFFPLCFPCFSFRSKFLSYSFELHQAFSSSSQSLFKILADSFVIHSGEITQESSSLRFMSGNEASFRVGTRDSLQDNNNLENLSLNKM